MIRCPLHLPLLLAIFACEPMTSVAAATQAGYVVAGIVVNSVTGQPLPGITVSLSPDRGGHSQAVHTENNGRFAFVPVPAAKYILSGSGPGYRTQGLNQHGYYFTGVAVGPDLDTTNIIFRLEPDASIRGQVLDEQNEPVRNATVQLFIVDDSYGFQRIVASTNAGTNDQGYYHFPHLAPGTYYVGVSARPWYAQYPPRNRPPVGPNASADTSALVQQETVQLDVAYPLTFYPDTDDSSQASALTLHAGEHATADVVMRAVPAAHLLVHYEGVPSVGTPPRIMQPVFDGTLIPVLASQGFGYQQGIYEFAGLAPGHYLLEMPAGNSPDPKGRRGWFRDIDLYGDMEISPGDSSAMANVAGMVVYQGAPPPRGHVYIELHEIQSGDSWTSEISEKGLFGLKDNEVRPGTYRIALYGASQWFITSITAQNAKVQGSQITLSPGASAKLICAAARGSAKITGTVMLDDKPFAGAMVLLVPEDTTHQVQRYRRDQSDSDGTFSLREVLPGRYTVLAIRNGWDLEWGNLEVLKPYLTKGESMIVSAGQTSTIKLQLQ